MDLLPLCYAQKIKEQFKITGHDGTILDIPGKVIWPI